MRDMLGNFSVRKFSLFDGTQEEKENILHIDDQSQEGGFVSHLIVLWRGMQWNINLDLLERF